MSFGNIESISEGSLYLFSLLRKHSESEKPGEVVMSIGSLALENSVPMNSFTKMVIRLLSRVEDSAMFEGQKVFKDTGTILEELNTKRLRTPRTVENVESLSRGIIASYFVTMKGDVYSQ